MYGKEIEWDGQKLWSNLSSNITGRPFRMRDTSVAKLCRSSYHDVLIARKPGVSKRKARNYLSRQRSKLELIKRAGNPCLKELRILCVIVLVRSHFNISASYCLSEHDTQTNKKGVTQVITIPRTNSHTLMRCLDSSMDSPFSLSQHATVVDATFRWPSSPPHPGE
jgi:hypothetical protein